jgi:BirA family biotin operon repressor/biotin-[acetyl-CoA-carboxylase] ligase
MTQPREEWKLPTRHIGRRVLVFDSLPSTNDFAASFAREGSNDGLAVLADVQTAGRGQHGRTWTAAPRSSVLLSVLVFPPEHLRRPAILTAWAAVAVCRTIHRTVGLQARIKWPNDVLLRGKKTGGILIEQGRGTVVGIGLNVQQTAEELVAAGLPQAASLAQFSPSAVDTPAVARGLLYELDAQYGALLDGDLGMLQACWTWHLGLLGRSVAAECHEGVMRGRLHELTFAGVVLVQSDGTALTVPVERVLHLERERRS